MSEPGFCLSMWDSITICYIDQTIEDEEADEFIIPHMQANCTYEPNLVSQMYISVEVDRYVDYLYLLASYHSYQLAQKHYGRHLSAARTFNLKKVRNFCLENDVKSM